ncbi:MAG TPA: lipoyl domain-containing protein, partial [Lunatimonas sp.]|nr:lipoyl domain-containing protein [Lunatimonas sp.]
PTNNIENVKSGHSARDEFEVANSYEYAVEGLNLETDTMNSTVPDIHFVTNGKQLSKSLGLETHHFRHVQHADATPPILNELYQKASWFALGAQPLFMLFGNRIDSEFHEAIWLHYSKYVKSRGLYSALKIGNQPYGILPVMNISNVFLPENNDIRESDKLFDKMTVLFARMVKKWLLMAKGDQARVPRLKGNDSYEDVLKILSMQENSSSYQIRALQYRSFKSKLYEWLKNRPSNKSILDFAKSMGEDYARVWENTLSLTDLLGLDHQELSPEVDQLLRAPILSLTDGNKNLIGFQAGKSIIMDLKGNSISTALNNSDFFSFEQEDLSNFQDFISALKEQKENELTQYRGDLSLFTDLLIRSFTNACQLYSRPIVFELELGDTSSGSELFKISSILKPEGTFVNKGDSVITIQGAGSKSISVEAPFDGNIKKILVTENDVVVQGTALFTLVNEMKYNEVKNSFITLGQQIIDESNGIAVGEERKAAQKKAIGEAVDLNSYRLDAWITSLAARRIEEMRSRAKYEKGIYFGAYGWIEDLEKDTSLVNTNSLMDTYREAGGIIHTPGAAQTVASTVFKNSFLSHKQEEESNPFTINLSSDRLQKSQFLLEGIRQGQELEALLGYQLERHLHDNDLHQEIYRLREAFPLYENTTGNSTGFVNLSVIDGLKAIKNKERLPEQVKKQIEKLEDTMDASLDTLFYEAGYQVTQGNLSQAAAAIDATKGDISPPAIESLKTRIPGTGINHKLVMVFAATSEQYPIESTRAFAEPNLENWLKEVLGPMDKIVCTVEFHDIQDDNLIDRIEIKLADLDISYLDFLYLSDDTVSNGAGELELRIRNSALEKRGELPEETKFVVTEPGQVNGFSLIQALEVARYAKELLSKCRYLKSEDLSMENEAIRYDRKTLDEIRNNRLLPLIERLKEIAKSDLTIKSSLKLLSNLDVESAKTALLTNTTIDTGKLKTALEAKITTAGDLLSKYDPQLPFNTAFDHLQKTVKILFGEAFILLPPALGSENFTQSINTQVQQLLVGDPSDDTADQVWGQERIKNWVQGVAQVHENMEIFEDWLMVHQVWNEKLGQSNKYTYQIAQGPTLSKYPWLALSKEEIDLLLKKHYISQPIYTDPHSGEAYPLANGSYYPDNCESTVLYAKEKIPSDKPVFGFLIDEFSEHIPNKKMDTGVSFNYNIPNNEPPQALLLAIHPKATQERDFFWSEDDLRDILYDTIDLYKVRMVDIEAIQEYGYLLPMTYWFNLPGNK